MNAEEVKRLDDHIGTLTEIRNGAEWEIMELGRGGWRDPVPGLSPLWYLSQKHNIRLKPWTLGRTVNGHTLPEGREWHRQDFTRDMLPAPYRPLMLGETYHECDQFDVPPEWQNAGKLSIGNLPSGLFFARTTRPIPVKPVFVPLGPEDVPPGSVVRWSHGQPGWTNIDYVTQSGLWLPVARDPQFYSYDHLKEKAEINRSLASGKWDANAWEPCRKEAPCSSTSPT